MPNIPAPKPVNVYKTLPPDLNRRLNEAARSIRDSNLGSPKVKKGAEMSKPKPLAPPSSKLPEYKPVNVTKAQTRQLGADYLRRNRPSHRPPGGARGGIARYAVDEGSEHITEIRQNLKRFSKLKGVKRGISRAFRSNIGKVATTAGKIGARFGPGLTAAFSAYNVYKAGEAAVGLAKAKSHEARTKAHTKIYYGNEEVATRTRKEHRRKRERKEAFKLLDK
jgi:hypothetical protein